MKPEELGWVAGLLEGEGSFMAIEKRGGYALRVSMQSTDLDVLQHLQRLVGGSLSGVIERPGRKPAWSWVLSARKPTEALMLRLHPLMGRRRQDAIQSSLRACNYTDPL